MMADEIESGNPVLEDLGARVPWGRYLERKGQKDSVRLVCETLVHSASHPHCATAGEGCPRPVAAAVAR